MTLPAIGKKFQLYNNIIYLHLSTEIFAKGAKMNYSKASLIIILLFVVTVMNSGSAAFPVIHTIFW